MEEIRQQLLMNKHHLQEGDYFFTSASEPGSLNTITHHYLLKENLTNSCDKAHITEVKKFPENMYLFLISQRIVSANLICLTCSKK